MNGAPHVFGVHYWHRVRCRVVAHLDAHVKAVHERCAICATSGSGNLTRYVRSVHLKARYFKCAQSSILTSARGMRWHVDAVQKDFKEDPCENRA